MNPAYYNILLLCSFSMMCDQFLSVFPVVLQVEADRGEDLGVVFSILPNVQVSIEFRVIVL